jgi:hypothetical protein
MSIRLDPECQEFFGAITLDAYDPLGNRIVTMLDVALRDRGSLERRRDSRYRLLCCGEYIPQVRGARRDSDPASDLRPESGRR